MTSLSFVSRHNAVCTNDIAKRISGGAMFTRFTVAAALAATLITSGVIDVRADEDVSFRRAPAYRGRAVYREEFERPYWWHFGYRPYRGVMPFGVEPRSAAPRVDVSCWAWRPSLLGGWRKEWVCGLW